MHKLKTGFTLVELLVVMAILGILATLVFGGFRSAQIRSRDAQRKSDLKQLHEAMELFFSDYNRYPSDSNGAVLACPYDPASGTGTACVWGTGEMTDGKTVYFKQVPLDPSTGANYFYRVVPSSNNQKFQVFAKLENNQDQDCLGGNCDQPPVSYLCGSDPCNFGITSSNTTPLE